MWVSSMYLEAYLLAGFYSVVRRMSGEGERGGGGVVVFLCSSICVYRQSPSTYATKGR